MGPLVLIPGFITPVLCLTNCNRQFPFLYNTVSYWPRPDATLYCFSNIILPLNCRNSGFYYISGLSYSW